MSPEQYAKAASIFVGACDLDTSERNLFLDRACAEDPELRTTVEALLVNDQQAAGFLSGVSILPTLLPSRSSCVARLSRRVPSWAAATDEHTKVMHRAAPTKVKRFMAFDPPSAIVS